MTNRLLRVFLLSLAAVAVCATPAWAADIEWTAATGNVNVGSNWNTLTVPTTGDMAYIRNAGTATIGEGNVFGGALLGLMVGYTDGVTSYGNVTQAGGTVTTGSGRFQVGVGDGSGPITTDLSTYTISGGLVDAAGYYSRIGYNSGYGKLAMSGTSQYHTNSHLYVGDTGGSGILEMSDTAIVTVGARLSLGNGSKLVDETRYYSTGALTMSGSSKIVADVAGTNSPVIGYNGGDATVTMTDSSLLDMSLATGVAYIGHGQESDVSVTLGTAAVGGDHTASMKFGGDLRIGSGPTNGNDLLGNVNSTVALYDHTSITAVGKFSVGVWNFCYGTLNLHDNASVTSGADFVIGDANDGSGTYTFGDGGNGTMTVSDNSTVNVGSSLLVGAFNTGHGTMTVGNMTGSATGTANVNVGSSTTVGSQGEGTLNLGQGGVLTTSRITVGLTGTYGNGVGTVKFNGGTVVAKASNNNFIAGGGGTATTLVQSGGLTIDSNGYDLVVKTDLLEDSGSTGGGLTKNGAGQLVLASDMNTITGATTVNAGTLVANTRDLEGTPFGATTVKAGACLTSAKWDTVTDLIKTEGETDLSTSSLTFDDGAKIGVILLDNGGGDLTGVSSITTGALAASATSALVEVVLPTTAPAGTGSYAIVNYASNSGVTFMPKVDGAGTKGVTITDDTMGTVSITLGDMNQWIPGGANPNYSVGGNWTDSVAPNGTAQRALFTGTGETVTLDMNATLSSLNFEGDGGYNIIASGAEKFTMDSSIAMNAHIQNVSGSNTVAAPIVLNKDTLVTVAQAVDTLTLSGAVTGAGRIEKVGAGTLAMADLGAGPAGDLVLGGGTFRYTGATATTNRGLSTTGAATIDVAGSDATLTLTGSVTTTGGGTLTKVGEGTIEFAGPAGTHALATGQVNVNGGSLAFGGTNGATYDINNTRTYIGVGGTTGTMELSGNATVTNTSSVHSYVGQGAGSVGTLSLTDQAQMVVTNTNADTWAGQLWVGRNAGATGTINLSGGTSTENPGAKLIVTGMSDIGSYGPSGETPAGKGYLNVHDYAQMETRGLVMGDGGEGYLLIDGNGKVTSTGNQWLRFGFFPTGVFEGELKDNATLHGTGAMYLGDDRGTATLTLTSPTTEGDGATLQVNGTLYVGNNGNDTDTTDGTLYINEGTAVNVGGHLYVGAADNANGTVIMNGGSLTTGNWLNIGRTGGGTNGATGTLTMNGNASAHAGGTFFAGNAYNGGSGTVTLNDNAQISSGTDICVAWGGIGVLNVGDGTEPVGEDTGAVATAGTYIRLTDSGNLSNATLNLNVGGTVETPYIDTNSTHASSSAVMNFDGGTLRALENTSANAFIGNTGNVASFALNVKAGGAKIDSNGFDVVINPDLVEDAGSTGGGLTKLGEGNLTLGGANTYTGDTRIEGGSLTTFAPSLNDFADVWISNGALFDLDFLGPDTIGALFLGGVSQALGTYGSSLSGATYQLDDYFSGTGMLLVTELTFVQIPGDADGDMKVDAVDAKRLAENWGATSLNPSYTTMWEMGDFNGDGKIDAKDASILAAQWGDYTSGSSESQGTAVPEPGMLALLLGLALAGLARRVRR